ncbi:MAG: VWA domain-containing protein [Thermoguttaceae bacterium]
MPVPLLFVGIFCWACLSGLTLVRAADEETEQPAVRRAVQQAIHHRLPAKRAEAFRRLKDFPPQEAAKLIVQSGLTDRQSEVRRAAYETLKTFHGNEEVDRYLLKALEKQMRSQADATAAAPLIAVLLASDSKEIRDDLFGQLDKWLAKSKNNAAALIAVADELGAQADDEQSLPLLLRLTKLACFSDLFAFRRAVVQAITHVKEPQVIGILIQLLPSMKGEVCGDIVRHLAQATGQPEGNSVESWQAWWKTHKDKFELPAELAKPLIPHGPRDGPDGVRPGEPPVQGMKPLEGLVAGTPSYYGMSIHARRMVFVIDISGSMHGARITTAKHELMGAINALPADAEFSMIAFNHVVNVWQPYLVRATPANKQTALRFVVYLNPGGRTAAYDALEAALRLDVEAIYFLTDGEPTDGKIVAPSMIVAAVSRINRNRRISIYSIGIAPGVPGGPLELFLKTLSEQNYGLYRRVDQ